MNPPPNTIFKRVNPGLVVFFFSCFFIAVFGLQWPLNFFPAGASLRRLPPWPLISYDSLKEYIFKQGDKPWLLIGDSVLHGDAVPSRFTVGYRLSGNNRFINLTNPSEAFPVETLLIKDLHQEYPEKEIVAQINPYWLAYSWTPEKFGPLIDGLQRRINQEPITGIKPQQYLKILYRSLNKLLSYVALDPLRLKIQYRWLNQSLSHRMTEWLSNPGEPLPLNELPFADQETSLENDPRKTLVSLPIDQELVQTLGKVFSSPPEKVLEQEDYRSLFEALLSARPRVRAVITVFNPAWLAQLPAASRENYEQAITLLTSRLRGNGIPYTILRYPTEDYRDIQHLNERGCSKAVAAIISLCQLNNAS